MAKHRSCGAALRLLRELSLADAAALVLRGLFDKARIAEIRLGNGYRDTAFDLVALVSLYRSRWSEIEGKTGISLAELEQAEIVADRLITAVGEREQAPIKRGVAIDERMRAFTLCLEAYNHTRHAIAYLRFRHDDANVIAPSLYAGRGGRPRAENEPEAVAAHATELEYPEADEREPALVESGISPPPTEAPSPPREVRVDPTQLGAGLSSVRLEPRKRCRQSRCPPRCRSERWSSLNEWSRARPVGCGSAIAGGSAVGIGCAHRAWPLRVRGVRLAVSAPGFRAALSSHGVGNSELMRRGLADPHGGGAVRAGRRKGPS